MFAYNVFDILSHTSSYHWDREMNSGSHSWQYTNFNKFIISCFHCSNRIHPKSNALKYFFCSFSVLLPVPKPLATTFSLFVYLFISFIFLTSLCFCPLLKSSVRIRLGCFLSSASFTQHYMTEVFLYYSWLARSFLSITDYLFIVYSSPLLIFCK